MPESVGQKLVVAGILYANRDYDAAEQAVLGALGSIRKERSLYHARDEEVRVYHGPADGIEIPRIELLAESEADDNVVALRLALGGAERQLRAQSLEDVRHEVTDRPVEDLSGPALYAEWSEAYECLFGTGLDDETTERYRERRRAVWMEMEARTDAEPPECPECGHRGWSQVMGGPKECVGCGYAPTGDEMELIEAIDGYWSKVRSQGGNE